MDGILKRCTPPLPQNLSHSPSQSNMEFKNSSESILSVSSNGTSLSETSQVELARPKSAHHHHRQMPCNDEVKKISGEDNFKDEDGKSSSLVVTTINYSPSSSSVPFHSDSSILGSHSHLSENVESEVDTTNSETHPRDDEVLSSDDRRKSCGSSSEEIAPNPASDVHVAVPQSEDDNEIEVSDQNSLDTDAKKGILSSSVTTRNNLRSQNSVTFSESVALCDSETKLNPQDSDIQTLQDAQNMLKSNSSQSLISVFTDKESELASMDEVSSESADEIPAELENRIAKISSDVAIQHKTDPSHASHVDASSPKHLSATLLGDAGSKPSLHDTNEVASSPKYLSATSLDEPASLQDSSKANEVAEEEIEEEEKEDNQPHLKIH